MSNYYRSGAHGRRDGRQQKKVRQNNLLLASKAPVQRIHKKGQIHNSDDVLKRPSISHT